MADSKPVPMVLVRSNEDVALDLMRFIAETTGYGKGTSSAGFSGSGGRNPEEHAEALMELYERCRALVDKEAGAA